MKTIKTRGRKRKEHRKSWCSNQSWASQHCCKDKRTAISPPVQSTKVEPGPQYNILELSQWNFPWAKVQAIVKFHDVVTSYISLFTIISQKCKEATKYSASVLHNEISCKVLTFSSTHINEIIGCLRFEKQRPMESFHQLPPVPHPKWRTEGKLHVKAYLKVGTVKATSYLACIESINNCFDLLYHLFQFPLSNSSCL